MTIPKYKAALSIIMVIVKRVTKQYEYWNSRGSVYDLYCLLGCNAMQFGRIMPRFPRKLLISP